VSITAQLGDNANRFNVIYTDPHLADSDYLLELRAYKTDTRFRTNQGFNQNTLGGAVTLGRRLFEQVDGSITYGYENVEITDVDRETAPELLLRQVDECAECATSSLTFALTRDTRDSFAEPTRGNRSRVSATYAGGFLDADHNFVKAVAESSQYWPLFWKFVGHLRGSLLWGDAFGDTEDLPVQERFYLGGPNTIRGFRNFTVSPKDPVTDTVTGGTEAWFVNGEVIFPLYEPIRLRGVVFMDVARVSDEQDQFSDFFTNDIKTSAGVGIRFNSPLGAIRLEWGFNLNPQEDERMQVLHFSAGTSF
jgi:outer membrane protein insertion porin family